MTDNAGGIGIFGGGRRSMVGFERGWVGVGWGRCGPWLVALLAAGVGWAQAAIQDLPPLPRVPPTPASAARQSFQLNDDLELELVAAEPEVCDPVALDFDEFGRAFVVEMRGYSEAGALGLGRVRRLVDADRNGSLEQSQLFAEGLRNPTTIVCTRGGVLVGDAPDLIFFKDQDGDGRADLRVVLFDGFGTLNIQQLLNNLQFGVDGRLYGASGGNPSEVRRVADPWPFGPSTDAPPGAAATTLRGRDFVIDLRTGALEATTGGGQFGQTLDGWGNRFVCSNSDHCQQIVIDDRILRDNPLQRSESLRVNIAVEGPAAPIFRTSPVESWRVARTEMRIQGRAKGPIEGGGRAAGYFSGATGICYFDGDSLPEEYRGNLFVADAGSNLVHRKRLVDQSLVKTAERVERGREFLSSSDNWFRPVQIVNAPDGALWVLDMYREVVEHPASLPEPIKRQLDLSSGNDRGRLYRIRTRSLPLVPRTLPGEVTAVDDLVAMLAHPNGWHRRTAARLLRERSDPGDCAAVERWLREPRPAQARLAALYLLEDWGRVTEEMLRGLLAESDPNLQVHGLRLARRQKGSEWTTLRLQLLESDDQRVRVAAAFALAGSTDEGAARAFARLAHRDAADAWSRLAILSSSAGCRAEVLEHYLELLTVEVRPEDFAFVEELARQMAASGTEREGRRLTAAIARSVERRLPVAAALWSAASGGKAERERQLNDWATQNAGDTAPSMREWLANLSAEAVLSERYSTAERVRLIGPLVRLPGERAAVLWRELFADDQPPEIRRAMLELAGQWKTQEIYGQILAALPRLSPELRLKAVSILLADAASTRLLLDAVESRSVPAVLIPASNRQQLQEHADGDIRERAVALLASGSGVQREKQFEATRLAVAGLLGDPAAGRVAFRKHCASCHRLEDEGAEIGPSLIGYAYRSREDLLLHVIDPNREVDSRYLAYSVQLVDGRLLLGVIAGESAATIDLKTAAGELLTLNRMDVEEIRSTSKSLMPENLADELTPQDLADLSAYLQSLRN